MGDGPRSFRDYWNDPRLKAGLAALLCLGGVALYAAVVHRHYAIGQWLFWDLAKIWGWTLALTASYLSLGAFFTTRYLEPKGEAAEGQPPLRTLLFSACVGLTAFCWCMYVAGALGWFRPWFVIVLPIACLALGGRSLWALLGRCATYVKEPTNGGVLGWLATVAGGFAVGLLYLQCLTPDAINYDAGWYHLPIAQDYARIGGIVPFPGDYNRCFPHLASLIHTYGFSAPGMLPELRWMMALTVEFTIVLWKLFGALVGAQWLLGERGPRGLWAAFFLFPSIFIYDQNIGGSGDHFLGFFAVPVCLALAQALERFSTRACVLLGITLGGAILTKYQSLYVAVICAVFLAARWCFFVYRLVLANKRDNGGSPLLGWKQLLTAAAVVAGTTLLVSSPHFIKNALFHHNPVYPFAQGLFPSVPSHEKSKFLMDVAYANYEYLPKGTTVEKWLNAFKLFFTFSFVPHYSFTKNFPSMGSLFTLLLPCLFLIKSPRRIWMGVFAAFIGIVCWGLTYIGDRYLQGIITIPIAVASALMVRVWQLGPIARFGLVPLVALQIVWGADAFFYSGEGRLKSAVAMITSGYDRRSSPQRRYSFRETQQKITRATPEDAVLMVRNYRVLLGIDRTTLSDVEAWQSVFFYDKAKGPRALYEMYRSAGVTHLLYAPNERQQGTRQASVLFDDLVFNHCKERKRFGGLELVTLPDKPPPPDPEIYRVLVLAKRGYPAGWYAVEQLNHYHRVPDQYKTMPSPKVAYSSGLEQRKVDAQLKDTRAVVVAKKYTPDARMREVLQRDFVKAEAFDHYSVYLRRR